MILFIILVFVSAIGASITGNVYFIVGAVALILYTGSAYGRFVLKELRHGEYTGVGQYSVSDVHYAKRGALVGFLVGNAVAVVMLVLYYYEVIEFSTWQRCVTGMIIAYCYTFLLPRYIAFKSYDLWLRKYLRDNDF